MGEKNIHSAVSKYVTLQIGKEKRSKIKSLAMATVKKMGRSPLNMDKTLHQTY